MIPRLWTWQGGRADRRDRDARLCRGLPVDLADAAKAAFHCHDWRRMAVPAVAADDDLSQGRSRQAGHPERKADVPATGVSGSRDCQARGVLGVPSVRQRNDINCPDLTDL